MASTFTTRMRYEKQADGENSNTWGGKVNVVWDLLDEARGGFLSKSVAGSSDVTLTANNSATDENRQAVIDFTGLLTGNIDVIVQTAESWWLLQNSTTGSFTLTVKTSAGSGIAITQGEWAILYSDGTDVKKVLATDDFGDVTGPASSTDRALALYSGTTGKLLKDGPALGSSTNILTSNGAGSDPTFQAPNIINDTTPQLGGNLDVNGKTIVSASNGNILVDANGSGTLRVADDTVIGSLTVAPDGTLHVHTSSAGAVVPSTLADDLIIETGDAEGGISILNTATSTGRAMFSAPGRINDGGVVYDHSGRRLDLVAQGVSQLSLSQTAATFALGITIKAPGQPSFLAVNSTTDTNVTGNGTEATVDFDSEIYDQNADFASDTFTAPVDGRYLLATNVRFSTVTAAADSAVLLIKTSNRVYRAHIIFTNNLPSDSTLVLTVIADMDAADTVVVTLKVSGEASDVVNIVGGAAPDTSFSGSLLN